MLIAGISGFKRNAAVALYGSGDLQAVCEEERATRIRDVGIRIGGFPATALDFALKAACGRTSEIGEHVGGEPGVEAFLPPGARVFDHHQAHAATAFLTSPYAEALAVVCDTADKGTQVSVWRGSGASLAPVDVAWRGPGFASVYSRMASLLGFKRGVDEYRVEALARRGMPADTSRVRQLLSWDGNGLSVSAGFDEYVASAAATKDLNEMAAAAAAVQQWLGELLLEFLRDVARRQPSDNLCLGGGLFFNTCFNTLVRESGLFSNVFIPVNPGNAGVAAGCALLRGLELDGALDHPRRISPFLGPGYLNHEIKAVLDNCKLSYEFCGDGQATERAVETLLRGGLVGWYRGRMEWGTRALGNRSIFANPLSPFVLENLNSFLKHRESYRAYGLAVRDEDLQTSFEGPSTSPYMECEYRLRDPDRLSSVFPEGLASLRVQTVGREPSAFGSLLEAFGVASGVPVLVNTSFNGLHEPIVCTPRDAVRVFYGTGLDLLVLGNFVLRK